MSTKAFTSAEKVKWLLENATPNGSCLESHKAIDKDGYCSVFVEGKNRRAHRFIYEQLKGPVGELYVLHTCDNPCCINIEHLFLGTALDNAMDMINKGRKANNGLATRAMTDAMVKEAVELYAAGWSQHDLANKYRVNQSTISLSLKRHREQSNGN